MVQRQGEGSHHFNEIRDEFLTIDTHSAAVTDASFAPDGTALATSSKDGTVKFFQVHLIENTIDLQTDKRGSYSVVCNIIFTDLNFNADILSRKKSSSMPVFMGAT